MGKEHQPNGPSTGKKPLVWVVILLVVVAFSVYSSFPTTQYYDYYEAWNEEAAEQHANSAAVSTKGDAADCGNLEGKSADSAGTAIVGRSRLLVPGRAGELDLSFGDLEQLVKAPAPLRGFQNKTGFLNPERYAPEYGELTAASIRQWQQNVSNGTADIQTQPPFECAVYVNHDYRFFWIRQRKTGSTTVVSSVGNFCRHYKESRNDTTLCTVLYGRKPLPTTGKIESWWRDYFVFTTVRNPYARFASAFNYLHHINELNQTFGESCENPFMVRDCVESKCVFGTREYLVHIKEQSSCMISEGQLVVDYVLQTESIQDGIDTVVEEINKRRKSYAPPIRSRSGLQKRTNPFSKAGGNYASLYHAHPQCIKNVDRAYAKDFKNLGYID